MKQLNEKILDNKKMGAGFWRMRICSAYLAGKAKPGQFVEVRCSAGSDPLLRRPLGIHRIIKGGAELLYEVVGKGTDILSQKKKGEELDLIGPLGNGFDVPGRKGIAILVAGGNGVAPLFALAEKIEKLGWKVKVLIGARHNTHILCEKEFKSLGAEVIVATEDGSKGHKGLVTHLLKTELAGAQTGKVVNVYACGPMGMLKAVANIARDYRAPCQVSLEERMACGVGVCLGCPVKIKIGHGINEAGYTYKMVCKDGPVFDAEEVFWE
ncbi:MAG: dihydroorotate dehydrogenase electron transfer subunit [Candidatus Omnitrophota bacterium]